MPNGCPSKLRAKKWKRVDKSESGVVLYGLFVPTFERQETLGECKELVKISRTFGHMGKRPIRSKL